VRKLPLTAWRQVSLAIILGLGLGWGEYSYCLAQEAGTEALGTPVGAFILYPNLTLGTEYNDNIYATDGDEKDDFIFHITPQVRLVSDWDNHMLQFLAEGDFARYADHTSEDTTGYRFLSDGRIDILRDTFATLNVGVTRTFEERGSANDQNGKEPTQEDTYGSGGGFHHTFNRFWLDLNGDVVRRKFQNVDAQGGGTINNHDRDRYEYSSLQRFGYDVNPDIGAFLQTTFRRISYDATKDDNNDNRDSNDYSLSAGLKLDVTDLIFGDVFGGITHTEYDSSEFDSKTSWTIGGDLTWDITELTTAIFTAARTWEETTVVGSSQALTTTVGATVTHSLLDTVSLDANFNYTREEFEGTNRIDNTYSGGPGVTYLMNRFLHWRLGYTYTQRESDAQGEDYIENVVLLTARLQY
jgi:hypothetical protein